MKKRLTIRYFYAYWDNGEQEKFRVKDFCGENKYIFEQIDCESCEGVFESIKHDVKLLPQVIVYAGHKELFRVKGKKLLDKITERLNK